jgi:hypothetical protein
MADNVVKIVFQAVDNASNAVTGMFAKINNSKLGGAVQSLTGVNLASLGAAGAVAGLGKAVINCGKEFVNYATQVENVSRTIGTTTEEASYLIQAADDLFISTETLTQGLKTAITKGYSPTIDGLKKMRDEYQAISDPIEKSKYSVDRFGRAGIEMLKFLEATPEKFDEMAEGARTAGLVLDDKAVASSKRFKESLDTMNDAISGIKINMGQWIVNFINPAVVALNQLITMNAHWKDQVSVTGDRLSLAGVSYERYTEKIIGAAKNLKILSPLQEMLLEVSTRETMSAEEQAAALDTLILSLGGVTRSQYDAIPGVEKLQQAFDLQMQSGMIWDTHINQWVLDVQALADAQVAAQEVIAKAVDAQSKTMISMSGSLTTAYQSQEDGLKSLQDQFADGTITQQQYDDGVNRLASDVELATHKIILSYMEQQLAVDGLDEKETAFLLEQGVAWGIYSQTAIDEMYRIQDEWSSFELPSKSTSVTISTIYAGSSYSGSGKKVLADGRTVGGGGGTPEGFASGGSFVIGSGYGYEGFNMGGVATASPGEKVTITPPGKDTNTELLNEVKKLNSLFSTLPVLMAGAMQRSQ